MTFEEKKKLLMAYCCGRSCDDCKLANKWINDNYPLCISFDEATEKEFDWALELIKQTPKEHKDNDPVNHPSHYTNGGMECIDEMILIFGIEYTMHFCLLNAWKYRRRALDKNGQQDMDKSHWYINKYKELKEKLDELHREQTIHF